MSDPPHIFLRITAAMKALLRAFDRMLARLYGVYEFTDDPDCLFHLSITRLSQPLALDGQTVPAGAEALIIHFWNEHLPRLPREGATLAQAARFQHQIVKSLQAVAAEIRRDPQLARVQAVGGVSALTTTAGPNGTTRLLRRLGFTITPYHNRLGRFGLFWENLYSWLLMWAYNEASLRHRPLSRLARSNVWMPVEKYLILYAAGEGQ